jgi:hypothetical protein
MDARVTTGGWVADTEHRALVAADGSGRADGRRHQRSFGSRRRSARTVLVGLELRRLAEIHRKEGIIPPPQHSHVNGEISL